MERDKEILLVEDDPALRDAIQLVLGVEGYRVVTARNGQDALEFLRQAQPAPCLVLLDLMLPGMDGRKFREEQARDPRLARIPVVILSGVDRVQAEATTLGAAGYIQKPVEAETLLTLVRRFSSFRKPEVVVVEGRASVGDMIAFALRHHGFTVHLADGWEKGLEVYRRRHHWVGLVLLDARAPGLDARRALTDLRGIDESVRCCFLNREESPYTDEELLALGAAHVFSQPLPSLEETARMLRALA